MSKDVAPDQAKVLVGLNVKSKYCKLPLLLLNDIKQRARHIGSRQQF